MQKLVAILLVTIWPAVTSHILLETLGVIHVAHFEAGESVRRGHQHHHHGAEDSHHHHHHHQDNDGEGEDNPDHHIFADGDYARTNGGKTLTKPELSICSSHGFYCASEFEAMQAELDSPGPAPPGTAPPLLQKTWQFSLRAAVAVRAPSFIS